MRNPLWPSIQARVTGFLSGLIRQRETSEERFRQLFERMPEPVWIVTDTHFIEANPAALAAIGYSDRPSFLHLHPAEVSPEYQPDGELSRTKAERMARMGLEKGVHRFEWVHKRCDGTLFPVEVTITSIDWLGKPSIYCTWRDITRQKNNEEALKASELKFSLAYQSSPYAIVITRQADGRILDVNPAFEVMTGYSRDEAVGKTSLQLELWGEDQARRQFLMNLIEEGRVDQLEQQFRKRNRSLFTGLISARSFRLQEDRLLLGSILDITERKQAEAKLQESEARFHALFEYSHDAILILEDGQCIDCNERAVELYGCTRQDIIGATAMDFSPAEQEDGQDSLSKVDDLVRAALTGTPQRFQWRHKRFDGSPFDVEVSLKAFEFGGKTLLQSIVRDITESKRAEAALRDSETRFRALSVNLEQKVSERTAELSAAQAQLQSLLEKVTRSEARFRTMFEQAPLGIALIDSLTGEFREINERYAVLAGRTQEEMAHIDWMQITHPDDVQEDLDQMARLNAGEIPGFQMNKRYLRPDGSVVWVSMTIAPVTAEPGGSRHHLALIEDITERMRTLEKLEELNQTLEHKVAERTAQAEAANAAKSQFLASMSHEIRTPMNAVLGLAQLLEDEPLTEDQRQMVHRINSAGRSLLSIINDILDFSKIEAGQLSLDIHPFKLSATLNHIDNLMRPVAQGKGLTLRLQDEAAIAGRLSGDALRIEQVLINLVGNALKFTEQGGVTIQVQPVNVSESAARLRFEIQDTGIGMSPQVVAKLFAPFTQADSGIARRFGGTGLGLSISKRLVELMGGEIGVTSTSGVGSTFWFELPFDRLPDEEQPESSAAEVKGPRLQGLRLLVVDDSQINLYLAERVLKREGAEVTLSKDGQQALDALRANPQGYDLVLMDIQMPVMDGLAATRAIREELGLDKLPVIALTAGVLAEEKQNALDAGVNDFLPKPMDLDLMATMIRSYCPMAE